MNISQRSLFLKGISVSIHFCIPNIFLLVSVILRID